MNDFQVLKKILIFLRPDLMGGRISNIGVIFIIIFHFRHLMGGRISGQYSTGKTVEYRILNIVSTNQNASSTSSRRNDKTTTTMMNTTALHYTDSALCVLLFPILALLQEGASDFILFCRKRGSWRVICC